MRKEILQRLKQRTIDVVAVGSAITLAIVVSIVTAKAVDMVALRAVTGEWTTNEIWNAKFDATRDTDDSVV
jgi:hypothetical protein